MKVEVYCPACSEYSSANLDVILPGATLHFVCQEKYCHTKFDIRFEYEPIEPDKEEGEQ